MVGGGVAIRNAEIWLCTKFEWKEIFSAGWLFKTTTDNNSYLVVVMAVAMIIIHNLHSPEIERLNPAMLTIIL
jgi:hypothetical protein